MKLKALAIVLLLTVAPFAGLSAGSQEPSGIGEVGTMVIDHLVGAGDVAPELPRLAVEAAPAEEPASSDDGGVTAQVDDPGSPYGWPNDNTLGYVTKDANLDRWKWDRDGPFTIPVDMGKLARKNQISSERDYIMELSFAAAGFFWYDADGKFDPVTGSHDDLGDDPCPEEPFRLFTVSVNGRELRTVEGHNTQPCTPGGPETGRTFEVKPVGDDPPYWIRIPKDVVREGVNQVTFTVHDQVLPGYQRYHSKYSDGWALYVATVMIELAAPPMVSSHGWSNEWNPGPGNAPWQPTLKANVKNELKAHFGQDPWRWAHVNGKEPFLMNAYDKKQDFRQSGRELRTNVNNHFQGLGYSGKGWIHGHSMGGLATRYYVEVLGGSSKIEKLAQTGSPNLGSWEAHAYTYGFWLMYEAADGDYTAKWHWTLPGWPFDCCVEVWHGWRDWWNPNIWAWERWEGPGHGREHLADFELKPPGSNPILKSLNTFFPAAGVQYFTVRGDWSVAKGALRLVWAGDGAVGLDSADMNGRIPSRIIDEFHETIPARVETARWYARYFGGLDLDTGKPLGGGGGGGWLQTEGLTAAAADEPADQPANMAGMAFLRLLPEDVLNGAYEHTVQVDAAPEAALMVMTRPVESPMEVRVRSPSGVEFGPDANGAAGVEFTELNTTFGLRYVYALTNPEPGAWTLLIDPADAPPAEGIQLFASGFVASGLEFAVSDPGDRVRPGDTAALAARLTRDGAGVPGATVKARTADGALELVLQDDGAHGDGAANDGVYGALWQTPDADVTVVFEVTAEGTGFARSGFVELVVAALPDLAVTAVSGSPVDAWGGDAVELTATVTSLGERAPGGAVTVAFYDGDPAIGGTLLGTAPVNGDLAPGETATATLATAAPVGGLTAFARVESGDLEADVANDVASARMPFNALPRTAATVAGDAGENGWTLGAATVTLAPFDGSAPPYAATWVSLDGAAPTIYGGPITVADEGAHELRFWSVDGAGNLEPERALAFGVDLAAPTAYFVNPAPGNAHVASASQDNPGGWTAVAGVVDVTIDASDAGSGIAEVRILVDGEEHGVAAQDADGLFHLLWDSTRASVGHHALQFVVEDGAGRAATGELDVYVLAGRQVAVEKDPNALRARLTPGGDS